MNAFAIIDAIDPKRFLRQRQQTDLIGWLQSNYTQDPKEAKRFFSQGIVFGMRFKVWVTVYERSVWLRLVILAGPTHASPVWKLWETNPRLTPDNHAQVVRVLSFVTKGIRAAIAKHPPEEPYDYTTKSAFKREIDAIFDQLPEMEK